MSAEHSSDENLVQIIGTGPSATGIFIAADRAGKLEQLLGHEESIVLLERVREQGSRRNGLGDYKINSNSAPVDFLDTIRSNGAFSRVLKGEAAKIIDDYDRRAEPTLPLSAVGPLLEAVRSAVFKLSSSASLRIISDANIKAVVRTSSGRWKSIDANGQSRAVARNVVLATGAEEVPLTLTPRSGRLFLSDDILTERRIEELKWIISAKDKSTIAVLGGSHAAFSVVHKLLKLLSRLDIHLDVFFKSPIKIFYPSADAAFADGYCFDPDQDVCPQTGRVHRYGGVRHDAADIVRRIQRGQEPRVSLRPYNGHIEKIQNDLEQTDAIIQAIGRRVRKVAVLDEQGNEIGPLIDGKGKVVVDERARVVGLDGKPIPGIFGTGLGYGLTPNPNIGGEPSYKGGGVDSVNIYWGRAGEIITEELLTRPEKIAPLENLRLLPPRTVWNDFRRESITAGKLTLSVGYMGVYNPPPGGIGHYGITVKGLYDDGKKQWVELLNRVTGDHEIFLIREGIDEYFN